MRKYTGKKAAYFMDAALTEVPDRREFCISTWTALVTEEHNISNVKFSSCTLHYFLAGVGKFGVSGKPHKLGVTHRNT